MPKIHVRVQTIEDLIEKYVENNGVEMYVDYQWELSSEQVDLILEGKAYEVRDSIEEDAYAYGPDDDLTYYWDECREATGCSLDDIDDWLRGDGFYPSYYLTDHDWNKILGNTSVTIVGIVWEAEYNFNNWSVGGPVNYADVKDSLKILGVNPLEYKNLKTGGSMAGGDQLKGWFPDMPKREPKINPNDLWDNLIVLYDGVMHFCFGDLAEIAEVVASDSKNLVIKKGTNIVFYDRVNGAGITETQLIGDITIPRKKVEFRNDTNNSYGIQSCYGFVHSWWTDGGIQNGQ